MCKCVHTMVPAKVRRGHLSYNTALTGELPDMGPVNWTWVIFKSSKFSLLTAAPSLQPNKSFYFHDWPLEFSFLCVFCSELQFKKYYVDAYTLF